MSPTGVSSTAPGERITPALRQRASVSLTRSEPELKRRSLSITVGKGRRSFDHDIVRVHAWHARSLAVDPPPHSLGPSFRLDSPAPQAGGGFYVHPLAPYSVDGRAVFIATFSL